MQIAVAGASGRIGKLITRYLLEEVAARNLILISRTPEKLSAAAAAGATVRQADYGDYALMVEAFQGADRAMIISALDVNHRVQQHRNAIHAAKACGVQHIVYTSTLGIQPSNPTLSAKEHIVTENDLRTSGMTYSILRNVFYQEIIATLAAQNALREGKWCQATGEGSAAPVSVHDIARSAVCCLLSPEKHRDATYEITGPEMFTFRELAALTAKVYGVPIEYVPVSPEERYAMLDAAGVPRRYDPHVKHAYANNWMSDEMVSADIAVSQNYLAILTKHVEQITGRPATRLQTVMLELKGKSYDEV